jgi:hypothetical protein
MRLPRINMAVHYVSHGTPIRPDGTQAFSARCRAAIITEVDPDDSRRVGLMVANPTGLFFRSLAEGGCHYDNGGADREWKGGTWHRLDDGCDQ